MKISHQKVRIIFSVLFSFVVLTTIINAASNRLSDLNPFIRKSFSAFTPIAAPVVQSNSVAPLEIEYKVEQASLTVISQSGSFPSPGQFSPNSGKIFITGNETIRPVLGTFSGFGSGFGTGRTVQRLEAKVSFPGFPSIQPMVLRAEFTQDVFGGRTTPTITALSISPNKITPPQVGEIEVFTEPTGSFNTSLNVSFKWKNGANGCAFPIVTEQPKSVTVCESSPASFSVAGTGNGIVRYQWRRNGVAIPGATNPTLNLSTVSASDSGTYEALVADDCGPVRSSTAFLGVNRPGEYSPLNRLIAAEPVLGGDLGKRVAISGNTIATTASRSRTDGGEAVYVYTKVGDRWMQEAVFAPSSSSGGFSDNLALDGDTIAMANRLNVYVYVRNGSNWTQQSNISIARSLIGSIALQGDTLAIGQPSMANGPTPSVGQVQIYQRTGTSWNLQATFGPSDVESYLRFGNNIALSGNTLVAGAANEGAVEQRLINGQFVSVTIKEAGIGTAYVFEKSGSTWGQKNKLTGKQKGDRFGQRVALSDNLLTVSSYEQITTGQYGALYLYQNQGSGWVEQQKLNNIYVPAPSFFDPSILSISQTKLLANNLLFTRTAQGVDPTPKALTFGEFTASSGVLANDTVIFGASGYNAGVNLEGAGAVFVTSLVPCGANLAVITSHPQNQQVADQLPAGFRIAFEQSSAITGLQWQVSTDGGNTYTDISGATRAELAITPDSPLYKNNNRFRVIIISTGGRITSDAATLTITATLSGFTTTSSSGLPVAVNLGSNTSIVFNNVTQFGTTTVKAIPLSSVTLPGGVAPPAGSLAFDVTTTATFTGPVTLTFNVPTVNDPAAFAKLRVYHGEGTPVQFVDRTVLPPDSPAPNYVPRQISARVTSLSPFVIAIPTSQQANTAPAITAVSALTRQQGSIGTISTLATVNDAETAAGSLTVTATTVPTGITITNITNTNGTVTANVAATANATVGNNAIRLTVTDAGGLTATANLTVTVTAAPPPPTGCAVTQLQQLVNYPTAETPAAVAHGDFNGDGKPDLVTANYEANAVSVLLNNGTGGFNPAVNYNAGGNPKAVAVGDLNGDGKLDLVVANLTSFDLSIFLGKGDGTFTAAPRVTGMSYPTSVAIGDFNNDGKADLVVANSGSFLTTMMYGNGDGTFAFGFEHFNSEGGMPYAVTAGDFNKDGRTDFAVAFNTNGKLGVYLNLPSGFVNNLQMFPAGDQPIAIAAGDFNADGVGDVAVANYGSQNVTVVVGIPAGGSVTTIAVGSLPESLVVVDLNGDQAKDLIVGNAGTNFVTLLTATSGGQFTRQDALGVESPSAVAATDFNGDGKVDVIVADYWVNRITTYQGSCETTSSLEAAGTLKTLRSVPSKYDGYPNVRSGNGRRGNTTRPRSQ